MHDVISILTAKSRRARAEVKPEDVKLDAAEYAELMRLSRGCIAAEITAQASGLRVTPLGFKNGRPV